MSIENIEFESFFPQHCYISQNNCVLTYDLNIIARTRGTQIWRDVKTIYKRLRVDGRRKEKNERKSLRFRMKTYTCGRGLKYFCCLQI